MSSSTKVPINSNKQQEHPKKTFKKNRENDQSQTPIPCVYNIFTILQNRSFLEVNLGKYANQGIKVRCFCVSSTTKIGTTFSCESTLPACTGVEPFTCRIHDRTHRAVTMFLLLGQYRAWGNRSYPLVMTNIAME